MFIFLRHSQEMQFPYPYFVCAAKLRQAGKKTEKLGRNPPPWLQSAEWEFFTLFPFVAALAALYLPLVIVFVVTECHFRICTLGSPAIKSVKKKVTLSPFGNLPP